MDIGIDLGTTYSVIAVKGRVQLVEGWQSTYLEQCDVTIIHSLEGDPTFPSVFWCDPADPTQVLVGTDAKRKVEAGDAPIMFAKRWIGTTEALRLHDRSYTPTQVAAQILRHLKSSAERALGRPVRRAVITHPAYFDQNQVEETRAAAREAGFDMDLPEQMMMEPTAAALAYTRGDERDPLLVMTYDLGGGTFDVTVMERRQGVITVRAFDGDHLLGGYNFDDELVEWVLNKLKVAGRPIPYDKADAEDRGRRARMLHLAEAFKIKLSEAKPKAAVTFKAHDVLLDGTGRPVQVLERLTQEQYSTMIKKYLDQTVECCREALKKAGVTAEELHEVLLVGGSSYGPWVQQAVEGAFGREPQLYEPDLCVAAGAAIKAETLPPQSEGQGIRLLLEVPPSSTVRHIPIAGQVTAVGGAATAEGAGELDGFEVSLESISGGGGDGRAPVRDGRFVFDSVELAEDGPSEFAVVVRDGDGLERHRHAFTVRYAPDAESIDAALPLPKKISIETAGGRTLVADEGAPLPVRWTFEGRTLFAEPTLKIRLYQHEEPVGWIIVPNIPEGTPAGSKVVIDVEITPGNVMRGWAQVEMRGGKVAARETIAFQFPPVPVPPIEKLREQYQELESRRAEMAYNTLDDEERLTLEGEMKLVSENIDAMLQRSENIAAMLQRQEPDTQVIYREIKKLDRVVNRPPEDMDPPRARFRQLLADCNNNLDVMGQNPHAQALRPHVVQFDRNGNDAYQAKDERKWRATYEQLENLAERIRKLAGGGDGGGEQVLPETPILKDLYKDKVDRVRSDLQAKRQTEEDKARREMEHDRRALDPATIRARGETIMRALDHMDSEIEKVDDDMPNKQALAKLEMAVRPLEKSKRDVVNLGATIIAV